MISLKNRKDLEVTIETKDKRLRVSVDFSEAEKNEIQDAIFKAIEQIYKEENCS